MKKSKYLPFEKFVLRTPLLSLDFFKNLTSAEIISDQQLIDTCKNETIREAIFLASPSLSSQIDRWMSGEITDAEKKIKLKHSVLKYLSRMSSRCTPYGLFAGCSVGSFSDQTQIILDGPTNHKRHTRLDMNYAVALSDKLLDINKIRDCLKFYPNSSIYRIGGKLRYIEYFYKDNIRHYDIVAVDFSEYLEEIITISKKGLYISEIIENLVEEDIDYEEAKDFVEELIENQILVSEIEPSVCGLEYINQLTNVLKERFKSQNEYLTFIDSIEKELESIDQVIGNSLKKYIDISNKIGEKEIPFDLKYLFQCDLVLSTQHNSIDKKILKDIEQAIRFVNRLRKNKAKNYLDQFKEGFYERYEDHEMPISKVLDPEIGIGYGLNTQSNDDNPLIDDLLILQPDKDIKDPKEIKWTVIDDVIQKKIISAIQKNLLIITLEDKDFSFLPEVTYEDLPETISLMIEIVEENNISKIKFSGGGGGSGANLLARFCHSDENINELVNEIIHFETDYNSEKIIAEIVHLPEARVGNILSRPDFRDFEIPYLARSNKPLDKQISLDDIMVSVRNNKIVLRSKAHNKEILPRLTNAHNYSNSNTLPIYHFLSDMQLNNYSALYIDVSNFDHLYKFIPRIEYKNIILSYASWNFSIDDIKSLIEGKKQNDLQKKVENFKQQFSLPDLILLSEGDNELLINLNNLTSVEMFIETVKTRPNFKLTEFIFNQDKQVVKDSFGHNFSNEIIMSFYKN
ncbi:lantibiotic dehydratase family protein [Chryseobacterium sp. MA9]|uniref:lantibiotic dehydratase family protein n=1 Tax=Chryseobacterium sp. MA9 TaxID=2966625 RepID=UPI002104296B|nr:lantibiotic dehydratase family protein [Chryseobacterium sp. MA9]UTX50565.1 lantibiotic dehydratase family protein [Chryseobacterium sp. MA9]